MTSQPPNQAGPPVTNAYKPKGIIVNLPNTDLSVYTHPKSKGPVIIFFYDMFGWNNTNNVVFQACDRINEMGYTVVMPDFFRKDPWPADRFPPDEKTTPLYGAWWNAVASDIAVRKDIYELVLPWVYENFKNKSIGLIGVSWGGLQAFKLASDDRFTCAAVIHGARIDSDLVNKIVCPIYYAPAQNDPTIEVVKTEMDKKKDIGRKCMYQDFSEHAHGFFAAHGNWSDPNTLKAVNLVFEQLKKFFKLL